MTTLLEFADAVPTNRTYSAGHFCHGRACS